ncbi:hypothetical protein ACWDBO_41745 [Streptomyces mirabilis]|uniref:hypothetical protein n=1 Tax=Streptomyces TaxID=1883 RepID=UPI0029B74C56|nr:hypothetical protein [Streptomyces sp. AK02-04a]MDX3762360.1 hypothetical protein [Streptomyces sp. AK02-04a]
MITAAEAIGAWPGTYPWLPLHFDYVSGALLDCRFDRNRVPGSGGRSGRFAAQQAGAGIREGEGSLEPGDKRVVDAVAPCSLVPLEQGVRAIRADAALHRLDAGQRPVDP